MWWSETRGWIAAAAVALAGCGFAPLYGEGSSAAGLIGAVAYETPDGRLGFHLRQALRERLGENASDPQYRLSVAVDLRRTGESVTEDNSITRIELTGVATYTFAPADGDGAPLTGRVESVTSYATTASLYATRAAERDAERRLARLLAERIAIRVSARTLA